MKRNYNLLWPSGWSIYHAGHRRRGLLQRRLPHPPPLSARDEQDFQRSRPTASGTHRVMRRPIQRRTRSASRITRA
jgi:hypothetical protein